MNPNTECNACPSSPAVQARQAIDTADKVALIHAIRALVTVKLWDMPDAELRGLLHTALDERAFHDFEVLSALRGGA